MSLILNIDTAIDQASVSISSNGKVIASAVNPEQKDHAAWMHNAINELIKKTTVSFSKLSAVAVSNGPGSYTGLRIGLAAAKGLCFALNIPLITIGTLEIMAVGLLANPLEKIPPTSLLCPMIDARRMEVYFALYNNSLEQIQPTQAALLDANTFAELLSKKEIIFFGNGSKKLKPLLNQPRAIFVDIPVPMVDSMASLSYKYCKNKQFADLAYSEPQYIKEFYSTLRR